MSGDERVVAIKVHLVDEISKVILATLSVKLSPMESKLSLSAIRTGVTGIFREYSVCLSPTGISKKSVDKWPMLKCSNDYQAIDNAVVTISPDCLEKFQEYMKSLKNIDSLMFVHVQGPNAMELSLYENWLCDDESTTVEDSLGSSAPVTNGHSRESTHATTSHGIEGKNQSTSIEFCLAKGFLMPAPSLKITIRASRVAKDLHGKSFTMYNIFVKQGNLV
jgi:hypothetical protein